MSADEISKKWLRRLNEVIFNRDVAMVNRIHIEVESTQHVVLPTHELKMKQERMDIHARWLRYDEENNCLIIEDPVLVNFVGEIK